MAYRIEIDRRALKVLARLPQRVKRQIGRRIDSLAQDPFPPDAEQIKGQAEIWRIRSGAYRIAYTVRKRVVCVLVLRIGDRKDFYRYFNR